VTIPICVKCYFKYKIINHGMALQLVGCSIQLDFFSFSKDIFCSLLTYVFIWPYEYQHMLILNSEHVLTKYNNIYVPRFILHYFIRYIKYFYWCNSFWRLILVSFHFIVPRKNKTYSYIYPLMRNPIKGWFWSKRNGPFNDAVFNQFM